MLFPFSIEEQRKASFSFFVKEFLESGFFNQIGGDNNGMDWRMIASFNRLTSLIDFDCQFIKGYCKHERLKIAKKIKYPLLKDIKVSPRCCCAGCAATVGYLHYIPNLEIARQIWELYDPKFGFWTKKGCKLPREVRSKTCLQYHCHHEITESQGWLLDIIDAGLEEIDEYYLKYIGEHERGRYGSHPKAEEVYKMLKADLEYEKRIKDSNQIVMKTGEQLVFGW